jgi:hypothetical protein
MPYFGHPAGCGIEWALEGDGKSTKVHKIMQAVRVTSNLKKNSMNRMDYSQLIFLVDALAVVLHTSALQFYQLQDMYYCREKHEKHSQD